MTSDLALVLGWPVVVLCLALLVSGARFPTHSIRRRYRRSSRQRPIEQTPTDPHDVEGLSNQASSHEGVYAEQYLRARDVTAVVAARRIAKLKLGEPFQEIIINLLVRHPGRPDFSDWPTEHFNMIFRLDTAELDAIFEDVARGIEEPLEERAIEIARKLQNSSIIGAVQRRIIF